MQQIKTTDDIKTLGTILGVWAHPDDETFTMAGILACAVANGQRVACVTATKGEMGTRDLEKWPLKTLGDVRAKELEAALRVLGVKKHFWLEYQDGRCADVPITDAVERLSTIIQKVQPNAIFTFGPDGMTGHLDHKVVSEWVKQAVAGSGSDISVYHAVLVQEQYDAYLKKIDKKLNVFFNIDKPPIVAAENCDICLVNTTESCERKCDALAAQPSQQDEMIKLFGRDFIKEAFRVETFIKAK